MLLERKRENVNSLFKDKDFSKQIKLKTRRKKMVKSIAKNVIEILAYDIK